MTLEFLGGYKKTLIIGDVPTHIWTGNIPDGCLECHH